MLLTRKYISVYPGGFAVVAMVAKRRQEVAIGTSPWRSLPFSESRLIVLFVMCVFLVEGLGKEV